MNWLEPFQFDFMRHALLVAILVGSVCAVFSCFLVLKGWSLMGDAISHAVLPGIVLAYIAGVPLPIGAFLSGLLCTTATGWIKNNSRIKEDTVLGVTFTGMFALGLVLFTQVESDLHLNHILFGNLLGIPAAELIQAAVISLLALSVTLLLRRDLLLYCFDPTHARSLGLPVTVLHYTMLTLLSLTIVASLQAVGIILVIAMLITPGCTGYLLTRSFGKMLVLAVSSAVLSSVVGVYASYFLSAPTGPCIVLVQSSLFLTALIFRMLQQSKSAGARQ